MKYILEGNDKELERVIKESRVRVNRGLISITPISECGLTKDHDVDMQEFVSSLKEKDALISTLKEQCEGFKTRIVELENIKMINDSKVLGESDSKELTKSDTKELAISDDKGKVDDSDVGFNSASNSAFSDDPDF